MNTGVLALPLRKLATTTHRDKRNVVAGIQTAVHAGVAAVGGPEVELPGRRGGGVKKGGGDGELHVGGSGMKDL